MDSERFHVIGDGKTLVEGWSTARLPFMPTDWRATFRQRLRDEVRQLGAAPGQVLHATLISPDTRTFDAENVLLYNVDLGRLAAASRYGIRFERALASPPICPTSLRTIPEYYHRYALASIDDSFQHWTLGPALVRWRCALPTPAAARRWQTVWYALKCGDVEVHENAASLAGEEYGLRVTLRTPTPGVPRAIDLIKPLFDGVVTALHRHDGTAEAEVCARLAALLAVDPGEISLLLHEERGTVLGLRRLVFLYGAGMMANPQDDMCFAGQLLLEAVEATAPSEVLVEVFAITLHGSYEAGLMEGR